MSKQAHYIKKLDGLRGDAALYRLDPPLQGEEDDEITATEYVVVSAIDLPFSPFAPPSDYRTSETMVFAATADEEVDFMDLAMVPEKNHAAALAELGYTITQKEIEA